MDSPYQILERKDIVHKFLSLCSLVSICENRKLNLANVFLLVLKEKRYRDIFKEGLLIDNNFENLLLNLMFLKNIL